MRTRRRSVILAHGLLIIVSIFTIAASLGVIGYCLFDSAKAEERLSGRRPTYLAGPLDANPLDNYGLVFGVGHNSGASLTTIHQALAAGADVIEIDVVPMGDTLISAHDVPLPIVGREVFRGPTLGQAWRAAADAEVIQLDVKVSTPFVRQKLIHFLDTHPTNQTVMIATSDITLLEQIQAAHPEVYRFLGIADAATLKRLTSDPDLAAMLDGVTIRHQLVSPESIAKLKAMNLIVLAWTVNDLSTVNDLVEMGVDAVSTDNLAIMHLLSGNQSGERRLSEHRSGQVLGLRF